MSIKIEIKLSCYICDKPLKFLERKIISYDIEIYPCNNCQEKSCKYIETLERKLTELEEKNNVI